MYIYIYTHIHTYTHTHNLFNSLGGKKTCKLAGFFLSNHIEIRVTYLTGQARKQKTQQLAQYNQNPLNKHFLLYLLE